MTGGNLVVEATAQSGGNCAILPGSNTGSSKVGTNWSERYKAMESAQLWSPLVVVVERSNLCKLRRQRTAFLRRNSEPAQIRSRPVVPFSRDFIFSHLFWSSLTSCTHTNFVPAVTVEALARTAPRRRL